jgi:RND family efflux transporter MFP subunit
MRAFTYYMVAGVFAVVSLSGCSEKKHAATGTQTEQTAVVTGIAVEAVKVAGVPVTQEIVGTVRARISAVVSTRIPGTVSVLRVREGDRVKKGQLLAQLEARETQANAAVATAGIADARQGVEESKSRKRLADSTFERYQKLFKEQAISRQEFDVKQAERDMAAQGVARAEARLQQSQEGALAAGAMADYTRIVAPISGIITSKQIDLGTTVFPSQPLLTVEDEGSYQLELAIPENIAQTVKPGTAVQITLDALGKSFAANIAEIVPSADPLSRTFTAKISLTQQGLKTGMFGRGAITLGNSINGILLVKKAIVERGALTAVWVVDKNHIARMRLVKVGKAAGDKVEVLAGLSDGEQVVVSGAEKVTEGAKVE